MGWFWVQAKKMNCTIFPEGVLISSTTPKQCWNLLEDKKNSFKFCLKRGVFLLMNWLDIDLDI